MSKRSPNSYGAILKSSSVIGGAHAVNYIIGMIRTKLVALLLGPAGVGLVGLYMSATSLVGTLAGLGIGSSAVREVAEADSGGDTLRVARTVKTLRRACWAAGLLGWVLTIALAYPLSLWTFGSTERALAVGVLGATLLLTSVSAGQSALLQGTRRIGDLARVDILSVLASTLVSVALYAWLRERGIVPVLISVALVNLSFSWWFARRIQIAPCEMNWIETWRNSKRLVGLGLAFMWGALSAAAVALAIRSVIVHDLGLDANGIYQSAWGISGMFAGFVLGAMGTDFYPRLTSVAHDHEKVNQLINEQTEIGMLLALPGLLGTLVFAPWVMRIFFTAKFLPGAQLLPWFVLGIFGQVISWPMGFALVAKGAARWYVTVESCASILRLTLSIVLLRWVGLWGTALAVPLLYVVHTVLLLCICRRLTGFKWASACFKLLGISAALVLMGFGIQKWLTGYTGLAAGALLTAIACLLAVRGVATRLGSDHRIVKMAFRFPGVRVACGI